MLKISVFGLILLFLLNCAGKEEATEPATTGKINGLIYNAHTSVAIDTAEVITHPPSSAVISDIDGKYLITNVLPGIYKVTAFKKGYDSSGVFISVSAGNTTIADIPLTADSLTADSVYFYQ